MKVMNSGGIANVPNKEGTPITPSALNMFEPVTLPIAISTLPFFTAIIETTSSGSEVPIAIAETAIISVPSLSMVEISTTDLIVQSADRYRKKPDTSRISGY